MIIIYINNITRPPSVVKNFFKIFKFSFDELYNLNCHSEPIPKGDPAKTNSLCGERRSQDVVGIFCLQKMKRYILCFDEAWESTVITAF